VAHCNDERLISLAAGVVQEFPAEEVVYAAANAGFNAVGVWCELGNWTDQHTARVASALNDTGITALDIEVLWFQPGESIDSHDRLVDIARAINARNILCVSSEPDIEQTKKRFRHVCELVEGSDIRVVLEFLAITEINTLAKAREVLQDVNHPAAGILVDTLHLQRTGSSVDDFRAIASQQRDVLPYLQLCDASATLQDNSYEGVLEDALYLRQLPGEGQLPLEDILQAADKRLPLSLEIRSRLLIETYPQLQDRADAVFSSAKKFFDSLSQASA
jgi:sugar phosphate isomerase/epimerase